MSWLTNRPLRVTLLWQILFVALATIVFAFFMGTQGAISALLGGGVSIASAVGFAFVVSRHKGYTAGGTIRTALRAEAVKIIITLLFLWFVFAVYKDIDALVFIGMFVVTVLINSMALLVADNK